jgi:hypothetical protein
MGRILCPDIAAVLCKGKNSVTRWLGRNLCDERDDPSFSEQINRLDAEISSKFTMTIV